MAKIVIAQMDNSKGLKKVILFSGLSHSVLLHPIVHGEPTLTAQAFYYLDELETVAKIRFENKEDELTDEAIEYLIDNYLFEFSKRYPENATNLKPDHGKFWNDELTDFYIDVDERHTQSLAIDSLNDPHVRSIEPESLHDNSDLSDWDIGRNYAKNCLTPYLNSLILALETKVIVKIFPSADRDGYFGKLRVLKPDDGLIDYWQAMALTNISIRDISSSATEIPLLPSASQQTKRTLSIERISSSKEYTPILLSHYFSGLKESNPLKAFVGFYNVLEYYFEDASRILNCPAPNEKKQLELVIRLLASSDEITRFINALKTTVRQSVFSDLQTSSGIKINGQACPYCAVASRALHRDGLLN